MLTKEQWPSILRQGFVLPEIPDKTPLPQCVSIIAQALTDHLLRSPAVREFLDKVPKGPGTFCPQAATDDLVQYVALRKGHVPKDDPYLNCAFMNALMVPVQDFWIETMGVAAERSDATGQEMFLIRSFPRIALAVNRLYLRWFWDVAAPVQAMTEVAREAYKTAVSAKLKHEFDYTVFDLSADGQIGNRAAWATAFPNEIADVIEALNFMVGGLGDNQALKDFHLALIDAYGEMDLNKLEERWRKVDELWLKLPAGCRISVTHGFEAYDHFMCVSPEHRLDVLFPSDKTTISTLQETIIQIATSLGLTEELQKDLRGKYARIVTDKFATIASAGWGLNFAYAGQAGPNREEVQEKGVRVIVDCSNVNAVLGVYRNLLREHCTPATAELLLPSITVDWFLEFVDSHELSHPVAKTKQLYEKVGKDAMQWLEEAKASLLGLLANLELHGSTPESRLEMVGYWVARIIRFMANTELTNQTIQPYVRENLAILSVFLDNGVLKVTPDGLEVDVEKAQSEGWANELEAFVASVLDAYGSMDQQALANIMKAYCNREEEGVAEVIACVNRAPVAA